MTKHNLWEWIDQYEQKLNDIALNIWHKPEVAMKEEYASNLQASILEEAGFHVKRNIAGMQTAFIAEYGNGKPILGVLGEFDALPGLSQELTATRRPIEQGAPGHGCGHNLLGTAGLGASLAIKEALEKGEISGTIRYYGCPAEETLTGKVLLAKEGVFNDLDACFTWHPAPVTTVWGSSTLAMNSIKFKFTGIASHAAAAPHMGRSALDGVELMNIGANYLREHIVDAARIHYSITNGGHEPNIVHPEAEVWYYIRAPHREEVEEITGRLEKIASGAAMMTETEVESQLLAGCYDTLSNRVLEDVLYHNMTEIQSPRFTEKDYQFAEEISASYTQSQKRSVMQTYHAPDYISHMVLHDSVEATFDQGKIAPGSTDVGDVSWITPLAQCLISCWPVGTAPHTWQSTAASGSGIGLKGMIFAAKTIAGGLYDLYSDDKKIEQAKMEFEARTKDNKYKPALPV
ncbi:hypothetical protein AC623_08660 [Bacillus sp. FJAT-27231]|uniref:amidohydrolase n=1 Tax=Bacillus sp. FJAT-27231 TaxID=1679168 RepID=UPI000670B54A|nr:amidohydrolase [Bacillus sp. FJAT-27231]KMY54032.1 hypothetical protein AC623_08660 [Bacillus sp. FJAT-27231]